MRDLIKELKENEKLYKNLSKQEQEILKNAKGHVIWYNTRALEWEEKNGDDFDGLTLYSLRPDYQEEPEFVYGEIDEANPNLYSIDGINRRRLWEVPPNHERIGFKFEHGKYAIVPVIYKHNSGTTCFWGNTKNIQAGEVKVIHATHVVLRKRCK